MSRLAPVFWLCVLLFSPPARAQAPERPEKDALGRTVEEAAWRDYQELLAWLRGWKLSPVERDFLLALLNQEDAACAPQDGPFRDGMGLVRHFAAAGVRLPASADSGLEHTDLWRLVRASRASSCAFGIPPAVLMCLTFRESTFNPGASSWSTSAKGVAQLTNQTFDEVVQRVLPRMRSAAERYVELLARELDSSDPPRMPETFERAADVDRLNAEILESRAGGEREKAAEREVEKRRLINEKYKNLPGHVFNLETNFGLASLYLAYLHGRFGEVTDPEKRWLTAIMAYHSGAGVANRLIYPKLDPEGRGVFQGERDYNGQPIERIFERLSEPATASILGIPQDQREELLGEVRTVHRCASRSAP